MWKWPSPNKENHHPFLFILVRGSLTPPSLRLGRGKAILFVICRQIQNRLFFSRSSPREDVFCISVGIMLIFQRILWMEERWVEYSLVSGKVSFLMIHNHLSLFLPPVPGLGHFSPRFLAPRIMGPLTNHCC